MNLTIAIAEYTPTRSGLLSSTLLTTSFHPFNPQIAWLKTKTKKMASLNILIDKISTLDVFINIPCTYTFSKFGKARFIFVIKKKSSLRYHAKIQLSDKQTKLLKTLFLKSPTSKTAELILYWVFHTPTYQEHFSESPTFTFPLHWEPYEKYEVACLHAKLQRVALKCPKLLPCFAEWGRYSEKHYKKLNWLDLDTSPVEKINTLIEKLSLIEN